MFIDTLQHWVMDLEMRLQKHILLLVAQNVAEVHPALTKNADIPVVEIPFPDYDERLAFVEHLMNPPVGGQPENRTQFTSRLTLPPNLNKEQLARDTAELNLIWHTRRGTTSGRGTTINHPRFGHRLPP